MRRDDPQYASDVYERVASARQLLMRAISKHGKGPAFEAASRLLDKRVTELAVLLDAQCYWTPR